MEYIRPSSELRNNYKEISKQCKETRKPIFITVNGKGDTALLNIEDYYQLEAELDLLRILADGEDDVRNNRVSPLKDTFDYIRQNLKVVEK